MTGFERVRQATLSGALLLGCATSGGASGETHFLCNATSDCAAHGPSLSCVQGACRKVAPDATTSETTGAGGADGNDASGGSVRVATGGASSGNGGSAAGGQATRVDAGPPAAGALTLKATPAPGRVCEHTHGQLSAPSAQNASVFGELLGCDISMGCRPDEYVVVDGSSAVSVSCSVVPRGTDFDVDVSLAVDGMTVGPSIRFQASGRLSPTGGHLSVIETNSVAQGGGADPSCTVAIVPNSGFLERGKIWAKFQCTGWSDAVDSGVPACLLEGAFLFENCSG